MLPGLSHGQAWAALHVALLGNHVLPLRLGEALRVTSVLRRTDLPPAAVTASALALRAGDVLAVVVLAAVAAPRLFLDVAGSNTAAAIAVVTALAVAAGALAWLVGLRGRGGASGATAAALRRPVAGVVAATLVAWLLLSLIHI